MQLLPTTALEMTLERGEPAPDLRDAATSLRLGARYLRRQLDAFGEHAAGKELALCAYNAGPGAVASWLREEPLDAPTVEGWVPGSYGETSAFVRRVLSWEVRWSGRLGQNR
jgi:soluble lytic murein transglycosylase-like protein